MTYFNPPYSKNVKTNIGGRFLKLIDKCFPKYHPLHKIVNRNTVKLSYKCMPNFKATISRHNQKLLKEELSKNTQVAPEPGCNCSSGPCPLVTNNCKIDHVIYRATVKDDNQETHTYTGVTRNKLGLNWAKLSTRWNRALLQLNSIKLPSTTHILLKYLWNRPTFPFTPF